VVLNEETEDSLQQINQEVVQHSEIVRDLRELSRNNLQKCGGWVAHTVKLLESDCISMHDAAASIVELVGILHAYQMN
jgi:hypothetical protein